MTDSSVSRRLFLSAVAAAPAAPVLIASDRIAIFDPPPDRVRIVVAMALRLLLGKSRFTAWFVSLSTMWFAINVLMTPYSPERQREIESLWALFR